MRISFWKYAVAAAAALFLSSCAEEMHSSDAPEQGGAVASYTAYADGVDTKAVLDGNVSKWHGEETIALVGKNGSHKFKASVEGMSSQATFVYAGEGEYDETEVLAVYPYASGAYSGDFDDMCVSGVTIPSEQTAVAGSYDPNAAIAVAHSTNTTLSFKNAVSLLKFTMGSAGVKNVTIWGEMSEVELEGEMPAFYQEGNVYLTVDPQWKSDGARFAAYFWGGSGEKWESMTAVPGQTNMYTCAIPAGRKNVIFCRMNGGTSANNWDNKWNQTVDLTLGGHMFTITSPWKDGGATGSWSDFKAGTYTTTLGISGAGAKVYYNDGEPVIEGASAGYVSLNGDFQRGKTYYIAVAPVVFEKGFTVEFSNEGDFNKYAVKSTAKRQQFKRNTIHDLGTLFSGKDTGFFTDPGMPDADKPCTIYYRPAEDDDLYGHTGDLYAHIWLPSAGIGSTWGDNSERYRLTKVSGEKLWKMTLSPSMREWFNSGTAPLQEIGIIARNQAANVQTADYFIEVKDDKYGVEYTLPEGVKQGINYNADGTVTLVFHDKDRNGNRYDWCYLLSELSNWNRQYKYKMHYDDSMGSWWITLDDLNPDKEYKFQYSLGKGSDEWVRTFDPYSEVVYNTDHDKWISDITYPGLWDDYSYYYDGKAKGFISAFKVNRPSYSWKNTDFKIEDKNDLVIYELLIRDFTDNTYGEGSIKAAISQLDYLKTLGVNAIELMPVQEFEGNDSWGYNPCAYFALDKAYGTSEDYKKFIDECHQRGIAVIFDVAYNHVTGAHPYAVMHFIYDGENSRPDPSNPWFNEYAPHQFSVHCDWDHSNPMVREHIKRNIGYLMTEYRIDGFRFDLSKGFTQNSYKEDSYDQSRVDYLNEYNQEIQRNNPNAVLICEHFVDAENTALGNLGIKVWRNMNNPYIKAQKRDMSQADFTGTTNWFGSNGMMSDSQAFGMLVGYQESHDEQRTNYEGQWSYNGSSIDFATRIERAKINAAFLLMSPGPKMIWQFGEIGYDISIEDGGRTGKKPFKTSEYMAVKERKALYDTYSKLLQFRKKNPSFFDYTVNFRWYVDSAHQSGRYLFARDMDNRQFALFGNFGTGSQSIGVSLPAEGPWYQYDDPTKVWNGSSHTVTLAEGQFYILVNDKSLCL